MEKAHYCVECGVQRLPGTRRCDTCQKEYKRNQARKRFGEKGRYTYGTFVCPLCGKEMRRWRKDQLTHQGCAYKMTNGTRSQNQHGRYLANKELVLAGISKPKGFCIHHLDGNCQNNNLSNLSIMHRTTHSKLHSHIAKSRITWLQTFQDTRESEWYQYQMRLTLAWLEEHDPKSLSLDNYKHT